MPFKLLSLSDNILGLEFEEQDVEKLKEKIGKLFGKVITEKHVVSSTVTFGGNSFTYYHEWDENTLIATSPEGCVMLEQLEKALRCS